jgi:hypothetical protein
MVRDFRSEVYGILRLRKGEGFNPDKSASLEDRMSRLEGMLGKIVDKLNANS